MGRRRPPMTLEEHVALGRELHAMRERLGHLVVTLSTTRHLPARVGDRFLRAQRRLDDLRSALDDLLYADHPASAHGAIYYPGTTAGRSALGREPRHQG